MGLNQKFILILGIFLFVFLRGAANEIGKLDLANNLILSGLILIWQTF